MCVFPINKNKYIHVVQHTDKNGMIELQNKNLKIFFF